jgi:hypothetical protein
MTNAGDSFRSIRFSISRRCDGFHYPSQRRPGPGPLEVRDLAFGQLGWFYLARTRSSEKRRYRDLCLGRCLLCTLHSAQFPARERSATPANAAPEKPCGGELLEGRIAAVVQRLGRVSWGIQKGIEAPSDDGIALAGRLFHSCAILHLHVSTAVGDQPLVLHPLGGQ